MIDPEKLVRENVKSLTPYSCARDPDPYQKDLKSAVSRIKGIPSEKIFLGNGSDEIIDLCFRIFCRPGLDKALTFTPTYGMYQVSASVNDIQMVKIPLDENFLINYYDVKPWLSDRKLKLIMICSPNNPTGNCMDRTIIEKIIKNFNGIVFLDEAYIDFADEPSFKEGINKYPNLIVMQTFSKAFGMASVRVGMAFASPVIIRYFNKMKPPYNISSVNQKTVMQRLQRTEVFKNEVRKITSERKRLSAELKKLRIIERVYPSEANFLLVKVHNAGYIYNYLVEFGIIVRNRSNIIDNCLRITVGTRPENNKLLKVLKTIQI
jgi:histidinol-phosphate aminotransferase